MHSRYAFLALLVGAYYSLVDAGTSSHEKSNLHPACQQLSAKFPHYLFWPKSTQYINETNRMSSETSLVFLELF